MSVSRTKVNHIVEVHLLHQSAAMRFTGVKNTYQKADMFCVMLATGEVFKFPVIHIFRVKESK